MTDKTETSGLPEKPARRDFLKFALRVAGGLDTAAGTGGMVWHGAEAYKQTGRITRLNKTADAEANKGNFESLPPLDNEITDAYKAKSKELASMGDDALTTAGGVVALLLSRSGSDERKYEGQSR